LKSLYIHIPFCKNKCLYCDFKSFEGKENLMEQYIDSLIVEMSLRVSEKVQNIFIGGGTPTFLKEEHIKSLGEAIKKIQKAENYEFTVEGNPGTFTREKLLLFKDMGVNRLSIGLQAWQNSLLKVLGRIHNNDEFIASYKLAREIGFNNINIDLMFGLPNQTIDMWMDTLEKVVDLNPEHLSIYSLIIEEGTSFYDLNEKGKLLVPTEEEEREMYNKAKTFLESKGYKQYEISNYSKLGSECKHNLVYWELNEYIGCGSAAHSYIDGKRYENLSCIEEYIDAIKEKAEAVKEVIINSEEDNIEEYIFMGLRKIQGISLQDFKNRFGKDINEIYPEIINRHKSAGLLIVNDENIRLSENGIELSNIVMSDFILTV